MSRDTTPERETLLTATVQVPQHVVFRRFPAETVVLNLQTGKYHGLNPTAGRMLERLSETGSVREAAALTAEEYEQPREATERDLCDLCEALMERGLIEVGEDDAG